MGSGPRNVEATVTNWIHVLWVPMTKGTFIGTKVESARPSSTEEITVIGIRTSLQSIGVGGRLR